MKFLKEMVEYQKLAEDNKKKIINKYNKFKCDIYEICDDITGAIYFNNIDAILLKEEHIEHPIFKIFDIDVLENKRKYTCNFNDKIILRGPDNYYFGVSHLSDLDVKREEIINCLIKVKKFILKVKRELNHNFLFKYEKILDLKLILAILDVIRNSVITNVFFCLMKENEINDIYLYQKGKKDLVKEFYELLSKIENKFIDIVLYQNSELYSGTDIIINEFITLQEKLIIEIEKNEEQYKKDLYIRFRKLREADNIIENIITIKYAVDNINVDNSNELLYIFGINYGGIELAIILYLLLKERNINTLVGNIMKKFRKGYIEAMNNQNEIDNLDLKENANYILVDENILTGNTLNKILEYLKNKKMNLLDIVIIQYPTVVRAKNIIKEIKNEEMYIEFIKRIKGMLIPTNYSKLCEYREAFIFPYMDKLGTFDLRKKEILKNMYKNGLYNKTSAVARVESYYKEIFI